VRQFDDTADYDGGLGLDDQLLYGLSFRMICSAVCLVRFMVQYPA